MVEEPGVGGGGRRFGVAFTLAGVVAVFGAGEAAGAGVDAVFGAGVDAICFSAGIGVETDAGG